MPKRNGPFWGFSFERLPGVTSMFNSSNCYTPYMNTNEKIGRYIFLGTLGLEVIMGYGIGLISLLNFQFTLETGFNIPYSDQLDVLGIVIGLALLFVASMSVLSIRWTLRGDKKGVIIGIAVGLYVFLFGLLAYLVLGQTDALLIDGIRGILTIVFGILLYRQINKES